MKRTETITVDAPFTVDCEITKAWEGGNGRRFLRGVASGVAEDRDGERVSARAIAKMAATPLVGGSIKLLAGTHEQDWTAEIGDITKLEHDSETDELIVETELDPHDPLAQKAWRQMTVEGKRLGFSIGGKLAKAYFELVDTTKGPGAGRARKRRVLDDILLKHVTLTQRPSYSVSLAQAVAKTFTDEGPAVDDTTAWRDEAEGVERADAEQVLRDALDQVAKARKPDEDEPPADDPGQQPVQPADGEDTPSQDEDAEPAAATGTTDQNPSDEPSDAEDAAQLPMARHLSCPHCGHEFAAPMPDDQADTPPDDAEARKSTIKETTMASTNAEETLAKIRAMVAGTEEPPPVEKVAEEPPPAEEGLSEVEKLVAASHQANETRIGALEENVKGSFAALSDQVQKLTDAITGGGGTGRRSTARTPTNTGVEKPDVTGTVGKTAKDLDGVPLSQMSREDLLLLDDDEITKRADTAQAALKAINKRDRGVA